MQKKKKKKSCLVERLKQLTFTVREIHDFVFIPFLRSFLKEVGNEVDFLRTILFASECAHFSLTFDAGSK